MGAPKLRSTLLAEQLLREGLAPREVRRALLNLEDADGNPDPIDLSLKAISEIKARSGAPLLANRISATDEYLPWALLGRDHSKTDAQRLRDLARLHAGLSLPDRRRRYLETWLKALTDANEVIDYQPDNLVENEKGELVRKPFVRVPRRKGKWGLPDEWLDSPWIRNPSVNDDGTSKWTQG